MLRLDWFLKGQHPHHDGQLHHSRQAAAEGKDPPGDRRKIGDRQGSSPVEATVPEVQYEVGHGHCSSAMEAWGHKSSLSSLF